MGVKKKTKKQVKVKIKKAPKKTKKTTSKKAKKATKAVRAKGAARRVVAKSVGVVTHYYSGIGVAIVKFSKPVRVGSSVNFKGGTTEFSQIIASMQFDHKNVALAPKDKEVGVKVSEKVREGDEVFLV